MTELRRTGERIALTVTPQAAYTRTVPEVAITYTCAVCGTVQTLRRGPGLRMPRYCLPEPGERQSKCQRAGAYRRVKCWRERKAARGEL